MGSTNTGTPEDNVLNVLSSMEALVKQNLNIDPTGLSRFQNQTDGRSVKNAGCQDLLDLDALSKLSRLRKSSARILVSNRRQ